MQPSVEQIFFYLVNNFPHISFSCSDTGKGGFRGEISFKANNFFTTDDIAVVAASHQTENLQEIGDCCRHLCRRFCFIFTFFVFLVFFLDMLDS